MLRKNVRHQEKNDMSAHERVCAELGCGVVGTVGRGLCKKHYSRWHHANVRDPRPRPVYYCRCGAALVPSTRPRATCGKRECKLAYRRERYRDNPEPVLASIGRWNERNKGWWHTYRAIAREVFIEPVLAHTLFERDGWRCQLCGRKVRQDVAFPHPMAPVIDHIIPLSVGGTHEYRNVQTAHAACNNRKGNRVLGFGEQLRLIG